MKHPDDIRARLAAGDVPRPPDDLLARLRRDIPDPEMLRRRRSSAISAGWRVAASVLMLVGLAYVALTALESYQRREASDTMRADSDYEAIATRKLPQASAAQTAATTAAMEQQSSTQLAGQPAQIEPAPAAKSVAPPPPPRRVPSAVAITGAAARAQRETYGYSPEPENVEEGVEGGVEGGVVGGVPGGVAGGMVGGVTGSEVATGEDDGSLRDMARAAPAPPPAAAPAAPSPVTTAQSTPSRERQEAPAEPAPIRVGQGVVAPVVVSRVDPVVSAIEKKSGRVPTLYLAELIIDREGNVASVRMLLPEGAAGKSAADAFRKWKFRPATRNGEPVAVYYNVTVHVRPQ